MKKLLLAAILLMVLIIPTIGSADPFDLVKIQIPNSNMYFRLPYNTTVVKAGEDSPVLIPNNKFDIVWEDIQYELDQGTVDIIVMLDNDMFIYAMSFDIGVDVRTLSEEELDKIATHFLNNADNLTEGIDARVTEISKSYFKKNGIVAHKLKATFETYPNHIYFLHNKSTLSTIGIMKPDSFTKSDDLLADLIISSIME